MYALVSLLNGEPRDELHALCGDLRREFCACGLYVTTFAHVSYQVAAAYNLEQLGPTLVALASQVTPFKARLTGLGVFTGDNPVVFIPVVRNSALTRLHQLLWEHVAEIATDLAGYYHPERWIPHVTLVRGDVDHENLGQIVRRLSEHDVNWEVTIDHIALIFDRDTEQGTQFVIPLKGNRRFAEQT